MSENEIATATKTLTPRQQWENIVSQSKGRLVFVPEKFLKKAKEMEEKRRALHQSLLAQAKKETELAVESQPFWIELRRYLAENGYPEIWLQDLGWETNALKDGEFVAAVSDRQ